MSWTKRQFIAAAFEEIGYATYVFDLEPEQLQAALRRLDAMMAGWNADGIRLSYPLPGSPGASDLDTITNVPDSANQAIFTNLACLLAPTVGKMAPQDTKTAAAKSYRVLLTRAVYPPEMQFPGTLPAGAGNKPWRDGADPYLQHPVDQLAAGNDADLEF